MPTSQTRPGMGARVLVTLAPPLLALSLLVLAGCAAEPASTPAPPAEPAAPAAPVAPAAIPAPPSDADIPEGPLGDAVRRGREIVTRTYETLPENVGNGLHCTSCHLDAGTRPGAGPWIGVVAAFPEYRARSGKVDTIQQRVNDCFERSMNGTALDPLGADMAAILAYMSFISRGVPVGEVPGRGFPRMQDPPTPDRARGEALYAERCASCHGEDGAGREEAGRYVFPALAGPRSFNLGAGMARLDTAAAFVRANMPLGQGGTLTPQEAYDVADYFIHLERPDFAGRDRDWPLGGKPRDARY